jgi:hypothetical protein
VKHKLKIDSHVKLDGTRLWYVECACGWAPAWGAPIRPGGPVFFGRPTWDAAFALGVAHQSNVAYPLTRSHSA